MRLSVDRIRKYINSLFGRGVKLLSVETLGKVFEAGEIKGYGYGTPLLITVEKNGEINKYVLSTIKKGQFGHEYMSDRASIIIWNHTAFNNLPRHVRSVDLGYFNSSNDLISIGSPIEFFQLTEYVEGKEYFNDLVRIGKDKKTMGIDVDRARILAEYISQVHAFKKDDPILYRRRIRDLIGHGEGIMGLIDSYNGDEDFLREDELKKIEAKCIEWRWRIRNLGYRLCRVHGDFHPWNIIFRDDQDFKTLDRSRGEWGEAADDISAMTINYIFFSLIYLEKYEEPYKTLFNIFIEKYMEDRGDEEIFKVIQPFYAWRGLVIASPLWYPNLNYKVRRMIFNFIHNVLDTEYFDYRSIDDYLRE